MSSSQDVFAKRAAITSALLTKPIDPGVLYADEYAPPFDYTSKPDNFPSRRFLPMEANDQDKGKDVTRILVITGNDDEEHISVIVKLTLEPYEDAMKARQGTEKQTVQGFHRFLRDHGADEWHLTLDEYDPQEDEYGQYPEGTWHNLTVEWLAKLLKNPNLRDSYLTWLESGRAKKPADLTANGYLVMFKVGMRVMNRTGGTRKWPDIQTFIVCFYRGFPKAWKAKFRTVHPSGVQVTGRQMMDFMQNIERAETTSKRRYDGRDLQASSSLSRPLTYKKARRTGDRGGRSRPGYSRYQEKRDRSYVPSRGKGRSQDYPG